MKLPLKLLSLLVCIVASIIAKGQAPDTTYYDAKWNIASKANMFYYRVVKQDGKLFRVVDHFHNGRVQMTGTFSSLQPEVQDGLFKYYNEKGQLYIERSFVNNINDGDYKRFYPSGNLHWRIHYKMGITDGEFVVLYENGTERRHDIYDNGTLKAGKCFTDTGKDTTYYPYEVQPSFIETDSVSLKSFLDNHTATIATENDTLKESVLIEVGFIVDEKGNIRDIKVLQGAGAFYAEVLVDAVKEMPRWKPGMQDGKVVAMPASVAMRFGAPVPDK